MKIMCVPLEISGVPHADARFVPIMQALSKDNILMGIPKNSDFDDSKPLASYMQYAGRMFRTLLFGLKHRQEIDLIFTENQVAPHALVAGIISVLIHKPCIWDSHGNMRDYCREANRSKLLTCFLTTCDVLSGRMIKIMVVPSELDRKHYLEQNFIKNTILVIPSGISLSEVDKVYDNKINLRKKLGLDIDKKILLFTGKGSYIPNLEALQWMSKELAPVLVEKYPNSQILIIGPWDKSIKVHPIIKFTGFVPILYEYLHAADLCLAPVRLENGISTKVIEYMACAKPMVVSQSVVKGTPQLMDGENTLIALNDSEFIPKTLDILGKPLKAESMGKKARKVIEDYYNWDTLANQWNQLIQSTASRK